MSCAMKSLSDKLRRALRRIFRILRLIFGVETAGNWYATAAAEADEEKTEHKLDIHAAVDGLSVPGTPSSVASNVTTTTVDYSLKPETVAASKLFTEAMSKVADVTVTETSPEKVMAAVTKLAEAVTSIGDAAVAEPSPQLAAIAVGQIVAALSATVAMTASSSIESAVRIEPPAVEVNSDAVVAEKSPNNARNAKHQAPTVKPRSPIDFSTEPPSASAALEHPVTGTPGSAAETDFVAPVFAATVDIVDKDLSFPDVKMQISEEAAKFSNVFDVSWFLKRRGDETGIFVGFQGSNSQKAIKAFVAAWSRNRRTEGPCANFHLKIRMCDKREELCIGLWK